MQITILASSSRGNGYLISDGHSTILIECGISIEKIQQKVWDMSSIEGCLITHEHEDHSSAAKDIIKYTKVYASAGTINVIMEKQKINPVHKHCFVRLQANKYQDLANGYIRVLPFEVQHDAVEPLGFLIYFHRTKELLLFATDTYYIKPRFKNLNYIMVECNYSKSLIRDDISKAQRDRLFRSHFELENVKNFLKANDLSKAKEIYLMHLSKSNSNPSLFKKEIEELTGVPTIICE